MFSSEILFNGRNLCFIQERDISLRQLLIMGKDELMQVSLLLQNFSFLLFLKCF